MVRKLLGMGLAGMLAGCGGGTVPPPSSITLTVVDTQNVGYAAAYQLGSGSWTALTPNPGGTYTISVRGNTLYGVAVRCNPLVPGMAVEVHVIQAAASELANPKVTCSGTNPSTVSYTLTVNAPGVPGLAVGDTVMASGRAFSAGGTVTSLTSPVAVPLTAPAGTQDLLVTVSAPGNPTNYKAAKVVRGVNISAGGSSSVTLTASDAPPLQTLMVTLPVGFSPTFGMAQVVYLSADNQGLGTVGSATGSAATNLSFRPVSGFGPGDRYAAFAVAGAGGHVLEAYKGSGGGAISLALPNPWPTGSLGLSAAAHPTVSGLSYSGANLRAYRLELEDPTLVYHATLGKGWLGTATGYSFPDLSSTLGHTPFASGSTVHASVSALLSASPLLQLDATDPGAFTATTDIGLAIATGSYTVGGASASLP
ncbi:MULTISPECIES: peptidase S8 and S53 subtilisin kexin sedolisin [Thermus]|uniref:peptidase S8 and S53 subtilisin kexin sedolisin n=1 Tax=Thermus TaxID=270 RepID=UPI001F3A2E80|nr:MULTISPECIES: peptidase S8 and S53 subtilisin kexin sedolisin [Thermus]